jgi:peptidoglycan/LPS O-acetylase OafA/YrhL
MSVQRYRSLDSLRGVAATLVILFHVNWNNHLTGIHFFRHAFLFVDLFFILSGFIIATIYRDRISDWRDAGRFMILRIFRLYPLHVTTLLFLVVLEISKYWATHYGVSTSSELFAFQRTIPAIFVNLAFLQGVGFLDTLSWNTPSWSISCEMIAYAAFALLAVAGIVRSRFHWLMVIPICAGYAYVAASRETLNVTFDIGTIRCLCGFFLGSLIARMPPAPVPNFLVAVSAIIVVVVVSCLSGISEVFVIPSFAVLVFALRSDEQTISSLLMTRPLAFLGKISFSIYMVHYLVISVLGTLLKLVLHAQPIPMHGWEVPVFDIPPLSCTRFC